MTGFLDDPLVKPDQWGFDKTLVDQDWEWFWDACVGFWPFWPGSNSTNLIPGNPAVIEGNAAIGMARSGRALDSNTKLFADRAIITHYSALSPGNAGTVVIFHYPTALAATRNFYVSKSLDDTLGGGAANMAWTIGTDSSPFPQRFIVSDGTSIFSAVGNNVIANQNRMDIGTWRVNGRVKLYENGVETADVVGPTSAINDSSYPFKVCDINRRDVNAAQSFVYYVAVLNIDLNAARAQQLAAQPFGPLIMTDDVPLFVLAAGGTIAKFGGRHRMFG